MRTFSSILKQQITWAQQQGITIDSQGYTTSLKDNLFSYPMLLETKRAFETGRGNELGEEGRLGKMHALHSSPFHFSHKLN